jgi:hypothetical protein
MVDEILSELEYTKWPYRTLFKGGNYSIAETIRRNTVSQSPLVLGGKREKINSFHL